MPDELTSHGPDRFIVPLAADHRIASVEAAYDAARGFINTREPASFSTLLRKPLAVSQGGLGHYGGTNLRDIDDPSYRAIARWIALESEGGEDPEPLTPIEARFARVEAGLFASSCATARCHGPEAGGTPFKLDPGFRGQIPIAATRNNYEEALAQVSLDGFPDRSRLLRKAQSLDAGIVHKGMNFDFFEGDPGNTREAILDWACAERLGRAGVPCAAPGDSPLTGIVYVAGPIPLTPAFDLDTFVPGGELRLAHIAGQPFAVTHTEVLTADLFPGPVDIRDPAVSRDGEAVVFAAREDGDHGHRLYLMDLTSRQLRPLTTEAWRGDTVDRALASRGSDRDPTFGPKGTVFFVSTRGGAAADRGEQIDSEIYSLDIADPSRPPVRWTFTPHVERRPTFFDLGPESGGELGFSALRDVFEHTARAHSFRFPLDLQTEYHQHFGITPRETFHYDTQELPDGRYLAIVSDLPALGEYGRLAVVDRNFGPELTEPNSRPSMEVYDPPMVFLTQDALYRDPAPLADGTVLVTRSPGALAPGSRTHIEHLVLRERRDGAGPEIETRRTLVSDPAMSVSEPTPLWVRGPVRAEMSDHGQHEAASHGLLRHDTATLLHQGLPLIDALLSNLPPSGPKVALTGIAQVRLVEHLPVALAWYGTEPTKAGRPARVLAEFPVESDGSFQVEFPAGVSFRIQALDAQGMAIGAMHDRWFYALPGQTLRLGIAETARGERYASQCAACHGGLDGSASPPLIEHPDAVTSASLTLARYQGQDPGRPRPAFVAGDATRVEVDLDHHIRPMLLRRCEPCHESPEDFVSLESRLVDRTVGRARASHLVELLVGRELDARTELDPSLPRHHAILTPQELTALIRWIEVGAPTRLPGAGP